LARSRALVTLIDRRNHHVFQPLLYQVATAALAPSQIARPIRAVLRRQRNASVVLAEVVGIDVDRRVVVLAPDAADVGPPGEQPGPRGVPGEVPYDVLVVAAGVTHSYFGHDSWAPFAPGLKTLDDAIEIRRRFLLSFERAERLEESAARQAELTFVIVGGGPTGVELAGALIEIARRTIPDEYRTIDTRTARVVLVEAMDRLLSGGFPSTLAERALRDLVELGVDVRLESRVVGIDAEGVALESKVGGVATAQRLVARNVIWAAGVRASPIAASLGVALEKNGRVIVGPDLTIPGHPEVFVVGDLAHVVDSVTKMPVPGMAPGAMQMGRYVAGIIGREAGGSVAGARKGFRYVDKGVLATIGRARAVAYIKGFGFGGLMAWLLWAGLHIVYLIGYRAKILVLLDWAWSYFFFERGSRLITGQRAGESAGPG
jgi:NADH dehydrogenase